MNSRNDHGYWYIEKSALILTFNVQASGSREIRVNRMFTVHPKAKFSNIMMHVIRHATNSQTWWHWRRRLANATVFYYRNDNTTWWFQLELSFKPHTQFKHSYLLITLFWLSYRVWRWQETSLGTCYLNVTWHERLSVSFVGVMTVSKTTFMYMPIWCFLIASLIAIISNSAAKRLQDGHQKVRLKESLLHC